MLWNRSIEDYPYEKQISLEFLNKLYAPKFIIQNVLKRINFVDFPFFGSTSFQIQKNLKKLFIDRLTSCNLKPFLRHQ